MTSRLPNWPKCLEHDQLEPCQDRPDCECPPPEKQTKQGLRHLAGCQSCWTRRNPK